MASVASQMIEEVTAHAQSESLEDEREICADGTYFPNSLRKLKSLIFLIFNLQLKLISVKGNVCKLGATRTYGRSALT